MVVRLTRAERKERTRDEIVEAARRVFVRDGFHGATLDAIAEEAGYTKGAVYSNFDGKDTLFLALLDTQLESRLAPFLDQIEAAESIDDGLRANARLMAETARREPLWAPLLVEFWTHASREADLRAETAARHDRVLDAVGERVAALGDRFGLTWSRPPREVVRSAQAFARGMALERLLAPDAVPVEDFEEEFLTFVKSHVLDAAEKGGRS